MINKRFKEGSVGSYKKGGKIKKTGMAKVHKGERVLNTSQTKKFEKMKKKGGCKGRGRKPGDKPGHGGFDVHMEPTNENGKPMTEVEKEGLRKEWQIAVSTAATITELTFKAKSGITQITEEEFDRYSQKKNPQRNSRPSPESPLPQPRVSPPIDLVKGVAARLVEKAAEKPAEPFPTPKVYDSIDEVLKIGVVKPMEQTVKVKVKPKPKEAVK